METVQEHVSQKLALHQRKPTKAPLMWTSSWDDFLFEIRGSVGYLFMVSMRIQNIYLNAWMPKRYSSSVIHFCDWVIHLLGLFLSDSFLVNTSTGLVLFCFTKFRFVCGIFNFNEYTSARVWLVDSFQYHVCMISDLFVTCQSERMCARKPRWLVNRSDGIKVQIDHTYHWRIPTGLNSNYLDFETVNELGIRFLFISCFKCALIFILHTIPNLILITTSAQVQ